MKSIFLPLVLSLIFFACVEEGDLSPDSLGQWSFVHEDDGIASEIITVLFTDSKGNVWIGTSQGLTMYNGESFITFTQENGDLSDNHILAIMEDRDHAILIGTEGGLDYFDGNQWGNLQQFDGIEINALEETSNGDIWIAASDYGLLQILASGGLEQHIDYICFDCNDINTLFTDPEGVLWIGSDGDLKSYDGTFESYTEVDGLASSWIAAIASDHWGNLWIGGFASRSVTRLTGGNVFEVIPLTDTESFHWVRSIVEDYNGKLWLASDGAGLMYFDGAVVRKMFDVFEDEYVTALTVDSGGQLWVGSEGAGIAIYTPTPN
jgi:ligand-binding sensor domain-containing protein